VGRKVKNHCTSVLSTVLTARATVNHALKIKLNLWETASNQNASN